MQVIPRIDVMYKGAKASLVNIASRSAFNSVKNSS